MADKLDPFLIGAFQDAISASKQYIEEVVDCWTPADKVALVSAFIDKYKSHGYPIDIAVLKKIGVPYTEVSEEAERVLCDLHEKCIDLLGSAPDTDAGAIILTKDEFIFRMGDDFQEAGRFSPAQLPSQGPEASSSAAAN